MPARGRTTNPYNWQHRKLRAALIPSAIGTPCPAQATPRCVGIMTTPRAMHLDHSTPIALGGTTGDRIICAPCNTSLGATLGNRLRPPQPTGPIAPRTCSGCRQTYQPTHHKQRCCSPACRTYVRSHRTTPPTPNVQRHCTECGTTFWSNHTNRVTCSATCGKTRTTRRRQDPSRQQAANNSRRRYRHTQATLTQQRSCTECGQPYKSDPRRPATCSPLCQRLRTIRTRRHTEEVTHQ